MLNLNKLLFDVERNNMNGITNINLYISLLFIQYIDLTDTTWQKLRDRSLSKDL